MKKKALKKWVRGLEADLYASQEQGAVERREAEVGRQEAELTRRHDRLRMSEQAQRIAQLEALCAQTTPVLEAAAERVKQQDAALANHWANVGAFVERARRVEKTATHLREMLSQCGKTDAEAGTVTYFLDEVLNATRSFDAAVARVAGAPAEPDAVQPAAPCAATLLGGLIRCTLPTGHEKPHNGELTVELPR